MELEGAERAGEMQGFRLTAFIVAVLLSASSAFAGACCERRADSRCTKEAGVTMGIRELDGRLCIVRLELSPLEFPELLSRRALHYPDAQVLEKRGNDLIEKGFEPAASVSFVQEVCRWGGGDRQMGRIRDNNSRESVAAALSEACALAQNGNVSQGVERIRQLRNLGQSFASKQLRFLEPKRANDSRQRNPDPSWL